MKNVTIKGETSKTMQIAQKVIYAVFETLKKEPEGLPKKDLLTKVAPIFSSDNYANSFLEKSGGRRWETILNFYSINCTKAGFLIKKSGNWSLTQEGEEAMKQGAAKLLQTIKQKYKEWQSSDNIDTEVEEPDAEVNSQTQLAFLETFKDKALEGINAFIRAKNPYEFQDLVATLLKAMGYYIAEVAKKGKDGGIDIIAYKDPLGVEAPRIIVQVKHYTDDNKVSAPAVQQLAGVLKRSTDIGIFVTSSSFTSEAKREAHNNTKHIQLIDFTKFVELWETYYANLSLEDRKQLPLEPIYFLGTNQ